MDDDPSDEPTVIESETHSGVSNGITATVAYAPWQHAGRPFLVRLEFSDPVPGGYMKMRNEALTVANGLVHRAYRTKAGGRHWTFEIGVYDSATQVTITLAGNRACRRSGSGVRPERPPAGQHPDPDHPGGGLTPRPPDSRVKPDEYGPNLKTPA